MLAISHQKAAQSGNAQAQKEKKPESDYESRKIPSDGIEDIVSSCPQLSSHGRKRHIDVFAGFGSPIEQVVLCTNVGGDGFTNALSKAGFGRNEG